MLNATQTNPVLQQITPEVIKLLVQAFQEAQNNRRAATAAASSSMDCKAIPLQDGPAQDGFTPVGKDGKAKAVAKSVKPVPKSHQLPPPALTDAEKEKQRGRPKEKEPREPRANGRSRSPKEDKDI